MSNPKDNIMNTPQSGDYGLDREGIKKIAFINFGGIGDEILFAPVIEEVKKYLPKIHVTLFLEDRSRAVRDLLPNIDSLIEVNVQGQSRIKTFFQLWSLLKNKYFDVVISSGSSPFIPVLLFLSGIPIKVGFRTGKLSKALLTVEAPLAPKQNRKGYAADMYFSLASSFLGWLLKDAYQPANPVLPHLRQLALEDLMWAKSILKRDEPERKILIHPGVSLISIQKNIIKGWPADSWAELIRQLTVQGHKVYLVGGPDDKEIVTEILAQLPEDLPGFTNLYGQTKNLKQLAALIQESDMLICVDSSPMHVAVGYEKPVVALFGPTDEKKLLPPSDERFIAVRLDNLNCRPCLWDVRNENCQTSDCLKVPVSDMLAAVDRHLAASLK